MSIKSLLESWPTYSAALTAFVHNQLYGYLLYINFNCVFFVAISVHLQTCCCGNDVRSVLCGSQESFELKYLCGNVCGRNLDCEKHQCERLCHVGPCDGCVLQPSQVTHCPCGKTALADIPTAKPRLMCTDEIPTCQQKCLRALPCGSAGKNSCFELLFSFFLLQSGSAGVRNKFRVS